MHVPVDPFRDLAWDTPNQCLLSMIHLWQADNQN